MSQLRVLVVIRGRDGGVRVDYLGAVDLEVLNKHLDMQFVPILVDSGVEGGTREDSRIFKFRGTPVLHVEASDRANEVPEALL